MNDGFLVILAVGASFCSSIASKSTLCEKSEEESSANESLLTDPLDCLRIAFPSLKS